MAYITIIENRLYNNNYDYFIKINKSNIKNIWLLLSYKIFIKKLTYWENTKWNNKVNKKTYV